MPCEGAQPSAECHIVADPDSSVVAIVWLSPPNAKLLIGNDDAPNAATRFGYFASVNDRANGGQGTKIARTSTRPMRRRFQYAIRRQTWRQPGDSTSKRPKAARSVDASSRMDELLIARHDLHPVNSHCFPVRE